MKTLQGTLRAVLANRIRREAPPEWGRFSTAWMAFNALYGGEPDSTERRRVMACVRRLVSKSRAKQTLRRIDTPVRALLQVPPGDMRLDQWDPAFRRASRRLARQYRDRGSSSLDRLAAVAGIVYQVRCNLLHGSKDPRSARDRMLVIESLRVLDALLVELET